MWILFVIAIINGQMVADYSPHPFKDQATCEAAKAEMTKALVAKYPTAQGSLTCFQAKPIGEFS